MAQQPEKSSSELSNSPAKGKKPKPEFIGSYVPGSVKKIVEDRMATTGKSQSEVLRDALTQGGTAQVPEGIMRIAYSLVPVSLSSEGEVVQATRSTGQLGVKTTARAPDRRVIEAEQKQTASTSQNLVWAYNNSVALRATLHLIAQTIIGAGYSIDAKNEDGETDNKEAKQTIEEFLDKTSFPEWIETEIENLAIFGNAVNMIKYDEARQPEKLIYVDWPTLSMFKHPLTGETKYVQVVKIPSDLPKSPEEWAKFDITATHNPTDEIKTELDAEDIIHAKIGTRGFEVGQSLIAPVITLVVYEKLLQWFMVQGAEIYGSPRVIASMELGQMPLAEDQTTKDAVQTQMSLVTEALKNFRSFGVLAMPPGWKIDIYGPGEHMMDYEKILSYGRKEQMLSCLGSTALFEAKGTELATSRTIETVWGYGLEGWRRVLKDTLDAQIFMKILRANGINAKAEITFNSERKWTAQEGRDLVAAGIITKEEARDEWGYPEMPPQQQDPGQPEIPGMIPQVPPIPADQANPPAPKEWGDLVGTIPLELSNQRPKRDQRYEERSRRIEERTAQACQESMEKAKQRIRAIGTPTMRKPDPAEAESKGEPPSS